MKKAFRILYYFFIVMLLFSCLTTKKYDSSYVFEYSINDYSTHKIYSPDSIVIDQDDNIYVMDKFNGTIIKFSKDGKYILHWQIDKYDDYFSHMYCNSTNNIYVLNRKTIVVFNQNGGKVNELTIKEEYPVSPNKFAIDNDENIYVSDYNLNYILVFDRNGNYSYRIGNFSSSHFNHCTDMVIDEYNNLYTIDEMNTCIQVFNTTGDLLNAYCKNGGADGEIIQAEGITIDKNHLIYIADTGNHRVQIFDKNMNFIMKFGTFGSKNGEMNHPSAIAVDSNGNIYISDDFNHRIQKFKCLKGNLD